MQNNIRPNSINKMTPSRPRTVHRDLSKSVGKMKNLRTNRFFLDNSRLGDSKRSISWPLPETDRLSVLQFDSVDE